jgi:hypothetical protein
MGTLTRRAQAEMKGDSACVRAADGLGTEMWAHVPVHPLRGPLMQELSNPQHDEKSSVALREFVPDGNRRFGGQLDASKRHDRIPV